MARFVITAPTGQTRIFDIDKPDIRIGRGLDCDLVLSDTLVSRQHVSIVETSSGYLISDLKSANGLFVNAERVSSKMLADGDSVGIGRHLLLFEDAGEAPAVTLSEKLNVGTVLLKPAAELFASARSEAVSLAPVAALPTSVEEELAQLRKKSQILQLLYDLGKTLGSVFSLDAIYEKVATTLYEVCPFYRMVVLLIDESTGKLRPVFVYRGGGAVASAPLEQVKVSATVTQRVIHDRVSLLSLNAKEDPTLAEAKSVVVQQLQSVMCAPLMGNSGVFGVIYLDQKAVGAFTPEDLNLLNAVASQASIAIENAQTHEKLTRAAEARSVYQRFLPGAIVEQILAKPGSITLGGVDQTVTVLFADIRGFTSLSEVIEPEEVVSMLNIYFSEMVEVIFRHGGTLDKFIGDGMMALFGAPYATTDDPAKAVRAAIEMQRRLHVIRNTLTRADGTKLDVHIGIGINTGKVIVGYIGSPRRTDYTAIGDNVNLASRLEHEAGGGEIIISEPTYQEVRAQFVCEPIGARGIKGKREPVPCYRVAWELRNDTTDVVPA